jgi:hypothetical protein
MTRQKSLKYISKLKQITIDFFKGNTEQKPAARTKRAIDEEVNAKGEFGDVFSYKQGRHKLKRKKPGKRRKLKK